MPDLAKEKKDQQHPQWASDRPIVNALLTGEPTEYNLAELARLRMRYLGFPGAHDIQKDLEKVLQSWGLTEETLHERTRQIHAAALAYKDRKAQKEDWS
jgi:hypothetical protein